ncbi:MAG: acyl-CoA dehydrogenase family protein [Actinobacteria bacterium]|nr:acyl-CoA dehydrogenase family protein [Actinomycetota bacterium]
MEFGWAREDAEFRDDLCAFLEDELPAFWQGRTAILGSNENAEYSRRFASLLADRNWLIPHWPDEYGGSRATPWKLAILGEELWSRGEPRGPQYMNANWIGPSIMLNGTDEQRQRYLPPIARGQVVWCQGFSEPEAGSDLAALRTTAVADGDEYIVNGSKIWTSYADIAEHCYLLVRTGDDRRNGISVLLVDMKTAGVDVRPIRGIVGEHSFCEVFLTDVRVPVANRLGPEGEGWTVVREALSFERVGAPRWARAARLLDECVGEACESGRLDDDRVRALVGRAWTACEAARVLYYRVIDERAKHQPPSPNANMARIAMVDAERAVAEACLELGGADALRYDSTANHQLRKSMAAGIAAGTYEVQLNLVAREHLKLPRG